jgi:hypothetical protein
MQCTFTNANVRVKGGMMSSDRNICAMEENTFFDGGIDDTVRTIRLKIEIK